MTSSHSKGVTFVDFPNHHIIADAVTPTAKDGTCGLSSPNIFTNSKVWGWRANGDGLHVFGTWEVSNMFMRTQDDSMYTQSIGHAGLVGPHTAADLALPPCLL